MKEMIKQIKTLVEKAAKAPDSGDAMKFSQAACNAVHTVTILSEIKSKHKEAIG